MRPLPRTALLAEAHHHVHEAAVVLQALHGAALGLQGVAGEAGGGRCRASGRVKCGRGCRGARELHSDTCGGGQSSLLCYHVHTFDAHVAWQEVAPASSSPAWAPWGSGRAPYRHEPGSRAPYLQRAEAGSNGCNSQRAGRMQHQHCMQCSVSHSCSGCGDGGSTSGGRRRRAAATGGRPAASAAPGPRAAAAGPPPLPEPAPAPGRPCQRRRAGAWPAAVAPGPGPHPWLLRCVRQPARRHQEACARREGRVGARGCCAVADPGPLWAPRPHCGCALQPRSIA